MQSQQIGVSRGNHSLFDGAKKKRKMRNEFEKSLYPGVLKTLKRFKRLLLDCFPLKYNKWWTRFARGGDTLDEGGPYSKPVASFDDNPPSRRSQNDAI
jgi:hypothetical protein